MPHLELERLAALDHESPTPEEQAHLDQCPACRREQEAFAQLADLAGLQSVAPARLDVPRLTEWESLATALRAEGLIAEPIPARRVGSPWWVRAAAAAVLLIGGVAAGRLSAGAALLPGVAAVGADVPPRSWPVASARSKKHRRCSIGRSASMSARPSGSRPTIPP